MNSAQYARKRYVVGPIVLRNLGEQLLDDIALRNARARGRAFTDCNHNQETTTKTKPCSSRMWRRQLNMNAIQRGNANPALATPLQRKCEPRSDEQRARRTSTTLKLATWAPTKQTNTNCRPQQTKTIWHNDLQTMISNNANCERAKCNMDPFK